MLIGVNAYNQKTNSVKKSIDRVYDAVPAVARAGGV
jgi:hypothetical protein